MLFARCKTMLLLLLPTGRYIWHTTGKSNRIYTILYFLIISERSDISRQILNCSLFTWFTCMHLIHHFKDVSSGVYSKDVFQVEQPIQWCYVAYIYQAYDFGMNKCSCCIKLYFNVKNKGFVYSCTIDCECRKTITNCVQFWRIYYTNINGNSDLYVIVNRFKSKEMTTLYSVR